MQFLETQTSDKKIMYTWFSAMYTRVDVAIVSDVVRDDLKQIVLQINALYIVAPHEKDLILTNFDSSILWIQS